MTNKRFLTAGGIFLAAALFLAANIVGNGVLKSTRLDLTEQGLYTLSPGTENILKGLDEPVTLRFYLSRKLATGVPGVNTYAVRVQELLEEYQRLAGDRLRLQILDPEPFSEEEDRAVAYGLQGAPVDNSNTMLYFGLVGTNSVDDQEVIPFFQPSRSAFLEYDVTKLVHQLAHPKRKVVGVMSTLPLAGAGAHYLPRRDGEQPWIIFEQMRQLFEVRTLDTAVETIPAEVDVLMVVHPKGLAEATLYAIDQFVMRGGRVLAFVDPYAEAERPEVDEADPMAALQASRRSEFDLLLNAWGVEMAPDRVAGDMKLAKRVQFTQEGRGRIVDYPVWVDLTKANFNDSDIITAELGTIAMASAGVLRKREGAEITFTPLIQTDTSAMAVETNRLGLFMDPEGLVRDFKPGGDPLVLAAKLSGPLKSAFPQGKPGATEEERVAHLNETGEAANILVVADTDLLEDRFWVQVQNFIGRRIAVPTAANGDLVTNALENLTGSNDLISVRNRGDASRPFTRVEEIRQAAEQRFREKEQELQNRLSDTEKKMRMLQTRKQEGNALALSAEQQAEMEKFRLQKLQIRKELRAVQHELRKDIESLEQTMKFINVGLMPLLIGIGGLTLGVYRVRRRRTR